MMLKNRLRNNLIRKIQKLSTEKLTEVDDLLNKIESQHQSREKTLSMAGRWKDFDLDLFTDFTTKLHNNRANDRKIS